MPVFKKKSNQVSRPAVTRAMAGNFLVKALELAGPLLAKMGLELVDAKAPVEGGRLVLRLFIDHTAQPDGTYASSITLDDCASFSRLLDDALENASYGDDEPAEYLLEVSSPGLDRPLLKAADYVRFSGRLVKVKIKKDGRNQSYKGRLGQSGADRFFIEQASGNIEFSFEDVVSCRLSLDDIFNTKSCGK